jgi:hypothetical protein
MNTGQSMYEWKDMPWRKIERQVFKLQKCIYQASRRGDTMVEGIAMKTGGFSTNIATTRKQSLTTFTSNSGADHNSQFAEEPCARTTRKHGFEAGRGGDPLA